MMLNSTDKHLWNVLVTLLVLFLGISVSRGDTATSNAIQEVVRRRVSSIDDRPLAVALLANDQYQLSPRKVMSIDVATSRVLTRYEPSRNSIRLLNFKTGHEYELAATDNSKSLISGTLSSTHPLVALSYYEGEKYPDAGIHDVTVEIQNLETGDVRFIGGHRANLSGLYFTRDGASLITSTGRVTTFPDGRIVISLDSAVYRWNIETGYLEAVWDAPAPVQRLIISEETSTVIAFTSASGSLSASDSMASILDLQNLVPLQSYPLSANPRDVTIDRRQGLVHVFLHANEEVSIDLRAVARRR